MPSLTPSPQAPATAPVLAVGAVVVVCGHILLVTRANPPSRGLWTVPGGRVEVGETMAEAVEREVAEETGLRVTCESFIGWVERIGNGFHFVIFDFAACPVGYGSDRLDDLPLVAGDDAGEASWIDVDELETLPLVPGLLDFLIGHDVVPKQGA